MKKLCFLFALLVLLSGISFAEVYKANEIGLQFNVPNGFKQQGKPEYGILTWQGPKVGARNWKIKIQVTPLMKGANSKKLCQADMNQRKQMKKNYTSVSPIAVKGAKGAFLSKSTLDPKSYFSVSTYNWVVTAYGKQFQYEWTFYGDHKTFNKYKPVIMKMVKSIRITK